MEFFVTFIIGIAAGISGGLFGIGGGSIIVPSLVLILGYSQHLAQGISVASMLPPVTILAAYNYYKHGYVNWAIAISISIGCFLGGYIGGYIANLIDEKIMRKLFGIFLLIISIHIIFKK